MHVRRLEMADLSAWESLTQVSQSFMQSGAWAGFKTCEGYRSVRLGLFRESALVGGATAYAAGDPMDGELWTIPGGPLLDWANPSEWSLLKKTLHELPELRKAVALRIEPLIDTLPGHVTGTLRGPADLIPQHTLEIPLDNDQQMLSHMKPKGRYNIKVARRHGVEVASSDELESVHELYFVLEQTARYQNFALEPRSFFINLAQALIPRKGRIVLARWHGITLAAAFIVLHGDTATYLYGGHLPIFANRMANYALHWHVMREASRMGIKRYDLHGYIGPEHPEHPYYAFSRFKEKLGGHPRRRVGSRDILFYDRLADLTLNVLGGLS